ncbi:hypothetical protein G6F46_008415 [Rhizopus delemar]|uniref:LAG1-DNAbind-domain-containing protein n=2 Tax=Rhizopus TaxID=4842 RepID=A0A9P6YZ36_9FUNG|nr:hypothetical protein G6F55_007401 [Rhizopus delemar]KAG1548104.1 hypothetical protein G6F51_003868 [Rhizopus arrhizus]KAG1496059.1 hypothetical protein G6F54_006739 [Rhizopus delemar]KAG1508430.1 hypothetical protein G6F53_008196 [Rhizopus delemar]KAG1524201.1 hypothetical protein G6F52_004385 [Rhizopus delemar]
MTGIPPQHDIIKHSIIFHNNDTKPQPPSPETPTSSSSSRKRKQDFQFTPDHLSFPQYNYAEPETPLALQHEKFIQSLHPDGSVGENEELMVVNFDQSNPFPRLTQPIDLDDLLQQRQAFQTWDASSSSPIQSPTRYSPGTPGFFTPGFLESLQEHPVYDHSLSIDYGSHHFNQEYNPLLVKLEEQSPEKNLVSQSGESVTSLFPSDPASIVRPNQAHDSPIRRSSSHTTASSPHRLVHLSPLKIKPFIQTYLAHAITQPAATQLGEKTVIVLTSKVAQKSYGTEKRFLCPPPTAILVGTSWWTTKEKIQDKEETLRIPSLEKDILLAPPKLTVSISGETSTQAGQLEWYTVSGATVGQTGQIKPPIKPESTSRFRSSESRHPPADAYSNERQELLAAGKSVSKHLYIHDADEKRKRVECLVKLQLANGLQLGPLASKAIKVISKPSKKRQSIKNMELCIHHGTTVSLFNRIRSQTVSTKYLGVSTSKGSPLAFPGLAFQHEKNRTSEGTCFVARTTSWDPFVIWIVDTSASSEEEGETPEDYIGHHVFARSTPYPPPPPIALKNKTGGPVPIHYNQHVVLQCLTTGLVSPVMIIRKVDRASTVVGGARDDVSGSGGEFGDEVLGDPVSQLHKIALQIVQDPKMSVMQAPDPRMPRTSQPVTYLACLNDMVGMHKTSEGRSWAGWDDSITSQEGGKIIRKRRVSTDVQPETLMSCMSLSDYPRRRVNSLEDPAPYLARKSSVSSLSSTTSRPHLGAFWSEDVSDAAVWTLVGTDCATYTFWSPFLDDPSTPLSTGPFPALSHFFTSTNKLDHERFLTMHGENFSRDLQVWFGDVKANHTEYRSRELIICKVPPRHELMEVKKVYGDLPILLVRGDGTICKTGKCFSL